jgi:hypothetical protein
VLSAAAALARDYKCSAYQLTIIILYFEAGIIELADLTNSIASIMAADGFHVMLRIVTSWTVPPHFTTDKRCLPSEQYPHHSTNLVKLHALTGDRRWH